MTSVLNVDSIAAKDGTSPVELTKQEAAKMYANFEMDGTQAITKSFNSASITDNGTGDYTITITTDMASVNYATLNCKDDGVTNNMSTPNENNGRTKATGSCHVMSTYMAGSGGGNNTKYDTVRMYVALMGDLA